MSIVDESRDCVCVRVCVCEESTQTSGVVERVVGSGITVGETEREGEREGEGAGRRSNNFWKEGREKTECTSW